MTTASVRESRWGAIALVLLVSAGVIKSSPVMEWIPGDLTIIAAAFVLLGMLHAAAGMLRTRDRPPLSWIVWAVALGSLGFFRSPASDYANTKTMSLLGLTLALSFVSALFLVRTDRQRSTLVWGFVGVGVLVAILAIVAPASAAGLDGRVALLETATIAPARALGAGLIVVLVFALARKFPLRYALPLAMTLLLLMIRTGSRGPVIAAVIAMLAVLIVLRRVDRRRAFVAVAVALVAGWQIISTAEGSVQDRFVLLLSENQGTSVSVRESLWTRSWAVIEQSPLGVGWGGLSPALEPLAEYPHNILLEVAAEAGVLAVGLLVVAFAVGAHRVITSSRAGDHSATAALALMVYWLTNALVSGDLNDNRSLFLLLAVSLTTSPSTAPGPPRATTDVVATTREL